MSCVFCDASSRKSREVKYSEHAIVLLSNPRLVKGHLLVIPIRHVTYPGDLKDEELQDIFKQIEKYRAKLLQTGLAEGVDIRQNYRPFLKQDKFKVDHLHFHVLPRRDKDVLYAKSMKFEKEIFADLSKEEVEEVIKKLT